MIPEIPIQTSRISGRVKTGDMSVNPQAGDEIKIEAKNVPKFIPGKDLKDAGICFR